MSVHTEDIDALQAQLMKAREDEGWFITGDQGKDFSRALTALVAERDALKQRVAELEARSKPVYFAHGQRLESIDLRERLVCAALTGMLANRDFSHGPEDMCDWAARYADATLAAMRKGGGA